MRDFQNQDYPHKELTERIIGLAIKIHRALGPGLLESAYQICLADEMERAALQFQREVPLPVNYEGRHLDCGYRLDFVVEDAVILELKSVEKIAPIHEAQLLTYLKLAEKEVGLIINFNSVKLRDGIMRRAMTIPSHSSASSAHPSRPLR